MGKLFDLKTPRKVCGQRNLKFVVFFKDVDGVNSIRYGILLLMNLDFWVMWIIACLSVTIDLEINNHISQQPISIVLF